MLRLSPLQFGFSKAHPPKGLIYALQPGDVVHIQQHNGQLQTIASPQLVQRIADKNILGEGLEPNEVPRAIALVDTGAKLFPKPEDFFVFVKNTVQAVFQYLAVKKPDWLHPVEYSNYNNLRVDPTTQWWPVQFKWHIRKNVDGAGADNLGVPELAWNGYESVKIPHFDELHWPLFASIFYRTQNIRPETGLSMLWDLRELAEKTGRKVSELINPHALEKTGGISTSPPASLHQDLEPYGVALNVNHQTDQFALFVLNRLGSEGQVLHGASKPEKIDPTQPAQRCFDHIAVETERLEPC